MTPSENGTALVTVEDAYFAHCGEGGNILCMNPNINLRQNFGDQFGKSENLTTFMQVQYLLEN